MATANEIASGQQYILGLGLKWNGQTRNFVLHALAGKWNGARTEAELRKQKFYKARYPGIRPDMSEGTYRATEDRYRTIAGSNNVNLTRKEVGWLMANRVSISEFGQRAASAGALDDPQQSALFDSFNQEIDYQNKQHPGWNIKPLKTVTDKVKFLMGESNNQYYQLWDNAQKRAQATAAGITVDNLSQDETSLTEGELHRATGAIRSGNASGQNSGGSFTDLSKILGTYLPESQIQGFGLTKDDLIAAEFGGPKQAKVKAMIQQLAANINATQTGQVTSKVANLGQRAAQGERA